MTDLVIPTYVPAFTPYIRMRDGVYILTLPNIEGVMCNVELSAERLAQLAFDVHRVTLIQGSAFLEQAKRGGPAGASSG